MAIGFPPFSVMSRRYTLRSLELTDLVEETFRALGWKYELIATGEYLARISLSISSWGEKVHVKIDPDGTVQAQSECSFPFQWLDFGKNRHNLVEFFNLLWSLVPARHLVDAADRNKHPYVTYGRTPVEDIVGDSGRK